MEKLTLGQLQQAVKERKLTRYKLRTCSICNSPLEYFFIYQDDGHTVDLYYNSQCSCTSGYPAPEPREWDALLEYFNRQTPEIRQQLWNEFLALAPVIVPPEEVVVHQVMQSLAKEGKIIEGGFAAFKAIIIKDNAPQELTNLLELCWYSSAQHLFGTIMNVLDPNKEPTDNDFAVLNSILDEVDTAKDKLIEHMKNTKAGIN